MKLSDTLNLKGEISITATNEKGEVRTHSQPNLITSEGLAFFASKIFDKNAKTFSIVGDTVVENSDTVNYYIADITQGTDTTAATKEDTYYTTEPRGTKIRKTVSSSYINEEDSSFYYQCQFRAIAEDTLTESDGSAIPINEVLLIAKSDYIPGLVDADTVYDSPIGSIANPKRLVARTVLTQPFTKYVTDRVVITWKIKLG